MLGTCFIAASFSNKRCRNYDKLSLPSIIWDELAQLLTGYEGFYTVTPVGHQSRMKHAPRRFQDQLDF